MAPIKVQLSRGISPHEVSLACAFGATIGVAPVLGVTTYLCIAVGVIFKLNHPILQLVHYLLYPLQLLLFPVFFKWSARVFHTPEIEFNFSLLKSEFIESKSHFFQKYAMIQLYSLLLWIIIAPFLLALIYSVMIFILKRTPKKST